MIRIHWYFVVLAFLLGFTLGGTIASIAAR